MHVVAGSFQVRIGKNTVWSKGKVRAARKGKVRAARKGDVRAYDAGFSLVEIAVAMVIIGLMVATALQTYKIYRHTKIMAENDSNMAGIELALGKFVATNGRYPCPMPQRLSAGDAAYGFEDCTFDPATDCDVDDPASKMLCVARSDLDDETWLDGGNWLLDIDEVMVGAIPFQTIGIPMKMGLDGWGRRFTYAVSRKLTQPAAAAEELNARRAIRIEQQFIDKTPTSPTYQQFVRSLDLDSEDNQVPDDIVVLSHGANGIGAWTADGTQFLACPSGALPSENMNCAAYNAPYNIAFVDPKGELVRGGGDYQNDDILMRRIWNETNYWTYDTTGIFNRFRYSAAVGKATPEYAVDVEGNVRISGDGINDGKLNVERICSGEAGGADKDCFYPERIGGEGMVCNGLATGFYGGEIGADGDNEGGKPKCATTTLTGVLPMPCPEGTLMIGVKLDGTVDCATPTVAP